MGIIRKSVIMKIIEHFLYRPMHLTYLVFMGQALGYIIIWTCAPAKG